MPLHHVELWVAESGDELDDWRWLLAGLGYACTAQWEAGETWSDGGVYITLTGSPNLAAEPHDRRRPGVNHLAFRVETMSALDRLVEEAEAHGWTPLYADRYPHAGGPDHRAGWLQNAAGFKVEVVACAELT